MGCCTSTSRHKQEIAAASTSKDRMPELRREYQGQLKKNRPAFPEIFNENSRTLNVPAEYPTISIAIQKANPNDRIAIEPGTYHEGILLSKSVELIGTGNGENDVVIRATGSTALTIEKSANGILAVKIQNIMFLVEGGKGNFDHVVDNEGGSLLIDDCILEGGYWGLLNSNSALTIVTNSEIRGCFGYGVFTADRSTLWMENNNVHGHLLSGINVQAEGSLATLLDNKVCSCRANGVMVCAQAHVILENNIICDNGDAGVSVCDEGTQVAVRHNTISRNGLVGVYCFDGAAAVIEDNDLRGNLHLALSVHKDSTEKVQAHGNLP